MARTYTYADKDEYDPDDAERLRCERCGTEYIAPGRCDECYVGDVVTEDDDTNIVDVFLTVLDAVERRDIVLVTFDDGAQVTGRVTRKHRTPPMETHPDHWEYGVHCMELWVRADHGIGLRYGELHVFVIEEREGYCELVDVTNVGDPMLGDTCGVKPSVVGVEIFEKGGDNAW